MTDRVTLAREREEEWREFYASQLERQTAALEVTAKKVNVIATIVTVWFILMLLGVFFFVLSALVRG